MYKAMIAAFGMALAAFVMLSNGCGVSTNVEVEDTPVGPKASPLSWENAMATVERKRELENPNVRDEPNPRYAPPRTPDPRLFTPVPTPHVLFRITQAPRIETDDVGLQYVVGVLRYNGRQRLNYVEVICSVWYQNDLVADAIDNELGLNPNSSWRFRAMILDINGVSRYDDIHCLGNGQ